MSMMRWDPFGNRMPMRSAMDRFFDDSCFAPRWGLVSASAALSLAVDMFETKNEVVVKAALPGVKPEQVELSVTGDVLTIRGETKEEQETKNEDYIRKEHRHGSFTRSVTLPGGLQTDKAEATFENGMLTLKIPKSEEVRPKKINVQAK
jgi:HSP20 family protein